MDELTEDEKTAILDYFSEHFGEYGPWDCLDVFASAIRKLGGRLENHDQVMNADGTPWTRTLYRDY